VRARIAAILLLAAAPFASPAAPVTVVAHDPGYNTSLSKHLQRWLGQQDIPAALATPAEMADALKDAKIAFLVGFNSPSAGEMSQISAYRARGGRLVVFHSASPQLAALMGVRPLGYKAATRPGQWSRMDFNVKFPEGCPKQILQTSSVLQRAEAIPGRSRVMATWTGRDGKPTGDAAWISSAAGYWMTHVLLADGDEALKAQLAAALVGSVAPELWNHAAFLRKAAAADAALRAFALAQKPQAGEIRAVWEHSGCGLYPGDWPKTIALLKEYGVTDLFLNVAGAGFAHYASGVLPRSRTYAQEGDQLRACLKAAKGSGVRVHAWILCFTATRSSPETLATFRNNGWTLKTRAGADTEYLDPSNASVRRRILSAIDELQTGYGIAGIHLDFVRWYELANKPKDAAETVSRFVADAKLRVRRPLWLTAAVLGKYPACVASVGQDWTAWLDSNSVDYVVPMDYTEDDARFDSYLEQHASSKSRARRTIAGIGVTANESRLGAAQVISQIGLVRKRGLAGVALFDLDTTLEKQILPYLKLGIWMMR